MSMSHFILKSLPIVNRKISSISNRRFSTNFPLNVLRRENIPTFALIVGLSALSFQIGVLYPWHEILSEDFQKLQVK